ncbi:MAG: hypothetical protein IKH51_01805 [Clostridia bacterium]|nr:hypothetical protein [Clostridia bacterium]
MKKIISAIITVLVISALCITASATEAMSADQILSGYDNHDLAKFGENDPQNTDLGDIFEETIILWGWYSTEVDGGITEFGYRYGDALFLGSPKFYYGEDADENGKIDDEGIARIAGGKGESVRFRIEIPVVKGEDIEVVGVVKLADGSVNDMWRVIYSSDEGIDMPSADTAAYETDTEAQTTEKETATTESEQTSIQETEEKTDESETHPVTEDFKPNEKKDKGDGYIIFLTICVVVIVFATLIALTIIKKRKS